MLTTMIAARSRKVKDAGPAYPCALLSIRRRSLPVDSTDKKSWLYAGLALAAGVGVVSILSRPAEGVGAVERRPSAGKRVLLVGDSLAVGLGPPLKRLASDRGVGVAYDGKPGTSVADWASLPTIEKDLKRDRFDLVLVCVAGSPEASASALQRDMIAVVRKASAAGAKVVWVQPPGAPQPAHAASAALGVPVFPTSALDVPLGPDGVHPTAIGYAGWAGALLSWLAS